MFIIEPTKFNSIYASNVPENDFPIWDVGTTYSLDDQVTFGKYNYQSVQGSNTGNQPPPWEGGDLSYWVPISVTNRWRPFDNSLGESTALADQISYELTLPKTINSVAIFGIVGESVDVQVIDPFDSSVIFTRSVELASSEEVYDAWTYFFNEIDYTSNVVVQDIPGYSGNRLVVTITSTGSVANLSEMFVGNLIQIGTTTVGTEVGIRDYSVKERDEFGNYRVVERGFTSVVNFNFAFPTEDVTRIKKIMSRIRASAAVFLSDNNNPSLYGTLVPGFYKDFNVPLTTTESYGVLEVESLI